MGSITLQHHHDHWRKPRREEGKSNSRFNNFPIVLSNSVPHQSANETLINDIHTPPLQFCFWQKLNAFSGEYAVQNRQSGSHPLFKWNIFIFMCSPLEYDMYSYLTVVAAQSHILRGMMNNKDRLLDIMTTFGDRTEERPGTVEGRILNLHTEPSRWKVSHSPQTNIKLRIEKWRISHSPYYHHFSAER